jgi:cyclopropane fatty-acyl-phospholipid synthase-like methyltransferase
MGRDLDTEEVAAIYDDLVDTYELEWQRRGHRSLHLEYYDDDHQEPGEASINTMRVLSEAADIDSSDRILNIGCGAGEDSVWNARAYGATVIGINISDRQLELAQENAREHDVDDRVTFAHDDFHELATISDDSIDVVWGLEALSHSPDRARVLEQARRVLVADGRVAFTDLFVRPPEIPDDHRDDLREIEDGLGLRLGPIDEFEQTLADTGFENIEIRDETEPIRQCTERRHKFARIAHPVGRVLSVVGLFSGRQLDAFRASSLIHRLIEADVLGYYLITADIGAESD